MNLCFGHSPWQTNIAFAAEPRQGLRFCAAEVNGPAYRIKASRRLWINLRVWAFSWAYHGKSTFSEMAKYWEIKHRDDHRNIRRERTKDLAGNGMDTRAVARLVATHNGILQIAKHMARGFRNFRYFRIAAYLKAGGLHLKIAHAGNHSKNFEGVFLIIVLQ